MTRARPGGCAWGAGDPPAGPLGVPGCPGVLAELAYQALLAGLCQHFALPFAGELAAGKGDV
jgi:hypothetical protein